ncbi:MAG: DUF2326 domain-containing protein [Desulfovibrio sp.]|jgi:uncharacterized protein YydD (DUF2326 family)|nr:DUF2326 domain-containing protein [Desulfovibrio sp.]
MKLIELSCSRPSFKTLRFNPQGLTVIVGDADADIEGDEGSSNGVGKTLSLGLVHHCLGAQVNNKLKAAVPDWLFTLRFSLAGREHTIARSGDGSRIYLDKSPVGINELRTRLNACGAFILDQQISGLTFRSLFSRFARYAKEDCLHPLLTKKEEEADGRLRSLFLLGIDCTLAVAKKNDRIRLVQIKNTKKTWNEDHILQDIMRAGSNPRARFEEIEQEIPKLSAALHKYQIAENYRLLEWQESEITKQLRKIEREIAGLEFLLEEMEKRLEDPQDITAAALRSLYDGLGDIFKPEALERFEKVEAFHNKLYASRKIRLEKDRLAVLGKKHRLEQEYKNKAVERDRFVKNLQAERALDEYVALAKHLASLEEERNRLYMFFEMDMTLDLRAREIREKILADDSAADEYLRSNPLAELSERFTRLAHMLYPNDPAGLMISNNTGDNQLRYDISVKIEGDDADGINSARILCFDWTYYMYGANHTMDFLWHDNRLFAHIDPHPRAAWFSYVLQHSAQAQKQYIVSLNTENLVSMKGYMSQEAWSALNESIRLTLHGDKPENKLLGMQFGSAG